MKVDFPTAFSLIIPLKKKNRKSGRNHLESEGAEPDGSHEGSISPDEQLPDETAAGPSEPKMTRLQTSTFQQLLEEPNNPTYNTEVPVFFNPNPAVPSIPAVNGFLPDDTGDLNFDNLDEIVAIAIKAECVRCPWLADNVHTHECLLACLFVQGAVHVCV